GGTPASRARFIDALELFGIGYSRGGYESLVIPFDPARARSATSWPPAGRNPQDQLGVRLSIGLEDPEDLMQDLERGFPALAQACRPGSIRLCLRPPQPPRPPPPPNPATSAVSMR